MTSRFEGRDHAFLDGIEPGRPRWSYCMSASPSQTRSWPKEASAFSRSCMPATIVPVDHETEPTQRGLSFAGAGRWSSNDPPTEPSNCPMLRFRVHSHKPPANCQRTTMRTPLQPETLPYFAGPERKAGDKIGTEGRRRFRRVPVGARIPGLSSRFGSIWRVCLKSIAGRLHKLIKKFLGVVCGWAFLALEDIGLTRPKFFKFAAATV